MSTFRSKTITVYFVLGDTGNITLSDQQSDKVLAAVALHDMNGIGESDNGKYIVMGESYIYLPELLAQLNSGQMAYTILNITEAWKMGIAADGFAPCPEMFSSSNNPVCPHCNAKNEWTGDMNYGNPDYRHPVGLYMIPFSDR